MKALLGWLGRTGMLYLVLCLAFAFYILAWPKIAPQLTTETLQEETMSVADIRATIAAERADLQQDLSRRETAIRRISAEQVQARLAEAETRREAAERELAEGGGLLDTVRPSRILAGQRLRLEIAALDAEIAALESARDARLSQSALQAAERRLADYTRIPTAEAVRVSDRLCREARTALDRFGDLTTYEQEARQIFLRERQRLENTRDEQCDAAQTRKARRAAGLQAAQTVRETREAYEQAQDWTMAAMPRTDRDLADRTLRDVLVAAAWALLGILLLPYLIRTLFYYVLAPFAERRRSIRIAVPGGTRLPAGARAESNASLPVTLTDDEELLVRQGFLQSTPAGAAARTKALLDWRNPLSSLASGMVFLTRIRGAGSTTVISADDDPFAEVAGINIPEGSALVLQPRALAAVVQPQDRPLRIASKWRLFNLNAWLTLQLRFLVFHGPARLVVKGGRGVRIEPVDEGRRFGQDQLVGFSADLAYSVARNETFLPYLLGREPLLRDRVEGGSGILIIEEAPYAGRRKGLRAGLEGTFDAFLKAFGI